LLCPPARIVKYESARFAVEILLLKEFCNTHSFDGFACSMSEKEGETFALEGRDGEFVGDVHQSFDVVPGDGAFQTMASGDMGVIYDEN
jgi:hypothetical protein